MQTSVDKSFLVKGLIDHFMKKGLDISLANYSGYKKPMILKRHAPDVMAIDKSNGMVYIGLVKTCNELSDQKTKEEFEDFPKRLLKSKYPEKVRLPFFIGVPDNCQAKVQESFKNFGIPWRENIEIISLKEN